ncbi:MAG: 3-deoxy-7-phosphoheptulonate synthase, partial [Acidimicrobiales bacterium]
MTWEPWDWKNFPLAQQPDWPDPSAVEAVEKELSNFPPLVVPAEINQLTEALARASRGEAFLLQAGDCAESF